MDETSKTYVAVAIFGAAALAAVVLLRRKQGVESEEPLWIHPEEEDIMPSTKELVMQVPTTTVYAPRTIAMSEIPMGPPRPGAQDVLWLQAVDQLGWLDKRNVTSWWDRFSGNNDIKVPYLDAIRTAADKYNVPTNLIHATIAQESSGQPTTRGAAGEYGLMQIMPNTATELGYTGAFDQLLLNPALNIDLGTKYLRKQLDRYYNVMVDAIAAYNAGTVFRMHPSTYEIMRYNGNRACPPSKANWGQGASQCISGPYDVYAAGPFTNQSYVDGVIAKFNLFEKVIVRY